VCEVRDNDDMLQRQQCHVRSRHKTKRRRDWILSVLLAVHSNFGKRAITPVFKCRRHLVISSSHGAILGFKYRGIFVSTRHYEACPFPRRLRSVKHVSPPKKDKRVLSRLIYKLPPRFFSGHRLRLIVGTSLSRRKMPIRLISLDSSHELPGGFEERDDDIVPSFSPFPVSIAYLPTLAQRKKTRKR